MSSETEVLIVGAGPTGLTVAIMLKRYGITCRIIDKKIKPVKTSNALAIHARTMEVWNDVGLLPSALEQGLKLKHLVLQTDDKKILDIDLNLMDSVYSFVLCLSQHHSEKMMIDYLQSQNMNIEMEVELVDFKQHNNKVDVTLLHKDQTTENIRANWLVACDGIHSIVRKKLNVAFQGKNPPQQFFLADMEIQGDLSKDSVNAFTSDKGILFFIPYSKHYWRMITDVTHTPHYQQVNNISFDDIKKLTSERCPLKLEITNLKWKSVFRIYERLAPQFNFDRIFLVGDAAHVHSPAGGQGMNIGIQDAYNLGWKLGLVIQGKLTSSVLETYSKERQPEAKKVIKTTSILTWMATLQNPFLRILRNNMMSFVMKFKSMQKMAANNFAELNVHYAENELIKLLSSLNGPDVGSNMPSGPSYGSLLLDKVRGKEFVLLIFMGLEEDTDLATVNMHINELKTDKDLLKFVLIRTKNNFQTWEDESIFDETKAIHDCFSAKHCCFYLIRPDKYIGTKGDIKVINKLKDYFNRLK